MNFKNIRYTISHNPQDQAYDELIGHNRKNWQILSIIKFVGYLNVYYIFTKTSDIFKLK